MELLKVGALMLVVGARWGWKSPSEATYVFTCWILTAVFWQKQKTTLKAGDGRALYGNKSAGGRITFYR